MPTYTHLITTAPTASGAGERMFETPKLFDAPDDKAASHEGAARGRSPHGGWRTVGQHRCTDAAWRQESLPDHPAIATTLNAGNLLGVAPADAAMAALSRADSAGAHYLGTWVSCITGTVFRQNTVASVAMMGGGSPVR
jgi:hypothetical protein